MAETSIQVQNPVPGHPEKMGKKDKIRIDKIWSMWSNIARVRNLNKTPTDDVKMNEHEALSVPKQP